MPEIITIVKNVAVGIISNASCSDTYIESIIVNTTWLPIWIDTVHEN